MRIYGALRCFETARCGSGTGDGNDGGVRGRESIVPDTGIEADAGVKRAATAPNRALACIESEPLHVLSRSAG